MFETHKDDSCGGFSAHSGYTSTTEQRLSVLWRYISSNYFGARRLKTVCVQLFGGFRREEVCKNSFLTHFKHCENSDHTPRKHTKDTKLQITVDSERNKTQRQRISEPNLVLSRVLVLTRMLSDDESA